MPKRDLRQVVATNLARFMSQKPGLDTGIALAAKAGIAQSQISRILRCEIGAGLDVIASVARALGVEPWELLADDEATRKHILERILLGSTVSNETVEQHLPLPPKVSELRRRKK